MLIKVIVTLLIRDLRQVRPNKDDENICRRDIGLQQYAYDLRTRLPSKVGKI